MKRIVIRLKTEDASDLIFASRAIRLLEESRRSFTEIEYGDPASKRVIIHKTKAGYALTIEAMP